jgi:hypothetical protein
MASGSRRPGDPQIITNDSGDRATIATPGWAVYVNGNTGQADFVSYYGQQLIEEDTYTKRLKLISQTLGQFPTVCTPVGIFFYAGKKGIYGLAEYDSQSGWSSGGLVEAGKGVSGGYAPTQTGGGLHQEGLIFVGEDFGGFMTMEKKHSSRPIRRSRYSGNEHGGRRRRLRNGHKRGWVPVNPRGMMLMGTEHGRVENIVLAIFGIFLGVRLLYRAYRGVWVPGSIRSQREPVPAAWYHRAFLLLLGSWVIYVAVYFLRR